MEADATPVRRGPRRSLTLGQIVQTALDLLDEDGSTAPSLRRVAARLGVRPNTLYTYVPDRLGLERAIVDHLLAAADLHLLATERRASPDAGRRSARKESARRGDAAAWRDKIEAYACSLRTVLLHRPGAVPLFFSGPMDGPNALEVGERLLELISSAGTAPAEASRTAYAVIVHVLGSTALTVADIPAPQKLPPTEPPPTEAPPSEASDDEPTPHERERGRPGADQQAAAEQAAAEQAAVEERRSQLAHLDAHDWPLTAATVDTAATWNTEEQFRWGLRRILGG